MIIVKKHMNIWLACGAALITVILGFWTLRKARRRHKTKNQESHKETSSLNVLDDSQGSTMSIQMTVSVDDSLCDDFMTRGISHESPRLTSSCDTIDPRIERVGDQK